MANASLEDCQLFAQSEILQRDLFIAAKQQEDHPKKREDCVQHEAESVSASSLKINRFRNRWNSGEAQVPSEYVIRDCMIRIEPGALDRALNLWNQAWGQQDEALALDGKTMKNALDENGNQTHIMSVVGHQSKRCYAQKKWVPCL